MTLPRAMRAMVTMGHGDLDRIVPRSDWPRPDPAPGEALIRVGACGLNDTDANTRAGWRSKAVSEATTGGAYAEVGDDDPTWGGAPIAFPRIQGADVCGRIEDTWGSDIATAAALHLGAATDPRRVLNVCDLSGYVAPRLAPDAPVRRSGRIAPPDAPGLGVAVDAEALGQPDLILD